MKIKLLSVLAAAAFLATSASASWVYADSGKVLESCCKKSQPVKKVVKKVKEPEICLTCDYSQFPEAKLLPLNGEKLQPATLKNCGK